MAPGQTVDVPDLPPELTEGREVPAVVAMAEPQALGGTVLEVPVTSGGAPLGWVGLLELQAAHMLANGQQDVMAVLGRQFESALIKTALKHTHGRKNDAAVRLGIGRNTITRKISEFGIDGASDD